VARSAGVVGLEDFVTMPFQIQSGVDAQSNWISKSSAQYLNNHPGASRHPSCPGGAMDPTFDTNRCLIGGLLDFRRGIHYMLPGDVFG
jgi:hypothetical protein